MYSFLKSKFIYPLLLKMLSTQFLSLISYREFERHGLLQQRNLLDRNFTIWKLNPYFILSGITALNKAGEIQL